MNYVLWAVTAALIAAALCWCCGQGARAAWSRIGPARPERRPAAADGPVPDACEREATRGIRDLERYLAAMSDPR